MHNTTEESICIVFYLNGNLAYTRIVLVKSECVFVNRRNEKIKRDIISSIILKKNYLTI